MYIIDRFEPPYIGMGIEISIPMYLPLQIYQIKQPALPHTSNSK